MVIGDAVTYYEDETGEVFSGNVGKALIRDLTAVSINPLLCYFTKAIKCWTPKNPKSDVIKSCREVLEHEIECVKPTHILLLGATAENVLFGAKSLASRRGVRQWYKGIQVVATVSPAAVVRQPSQRPEFEADLRYFSRLVHNYPEIPPDFDWEFIDGTSPGQLREFKSDVEVSDAIAYDIETVGLDEYAEGGRIWMIGFATRKKNYVMQINERTTAIIKYVLCGDTAWTRVAHNAKFDNRWLRSRGISPTVDFDTYLAAYLIDVSTPHGLKYLSKAYLGAADYNEDIEFKSKLTRSEFMAMAKYCALDCYYTLRLHTLTKNTMEADGGLMRVFTRIVIPGERILQGIESVGAYVDQTRLAEVEADYTKKREELDARIDAALPEKYRGGKINLGSPKQLSKLLYEDLGLSTEARTSTGDMSTGKHALLRLVDAHEIPKLLLERKKYDRVITGFFTPWKDFLKRDGRLHTTYKIAETSTGRLSAENPNLQQVPRDSNVRSLICAPPGKVFIEGDYSQLELRVAAYVAGAESMKECYRRGEDLHRKTAAQIAGITPEEVTKAQRTAAKAVNFGYIYGMWWRSFKEYAFDSYGVVVTDEEAKRSREVYFETYPELVPWHDYQKRYVREHKYVKTATGRRRYLLDVDSPDDELRGGAERKAINTPVQSLGSDITLLAMQLIDKNIKRLYPGKAFMVGQVHDAIMLEADEDVGREVALLTKRCMEGVPQILKKYFGIDFDVPIISEVELGSAWGVGEVVEP